MDHGYRAEWVSPQAIPHLDFFLKDIEAVWASRGGGAGLSESLTQKLATAHEKIQAFVVYQQNNPVGFAWLEKTTAHYGNMVVHALTPEAAAFIACTLAQSGHLKTVFSELIQFDETEIYRDTFLNLGLLENSRQRMSLELSTYITEHTFSEAMMLETSFAYMTPQHLAVSSEISFLAHQVSQDYAGYPDLETLEKRIGLETMVFDKLYGPIIPEASLFVCYQGYAVGSCLVIEIPCWGYERVPWIFDLCIHPDYHGKGFGKRLFQESLSVLQTQGYPIVGLAVTLSNSSAIALYQNLGFETVEYFSEFSQ